MDDGKGDTRITEDRRPEERKIVTRKQGKETY